MTGVTATQLEGRANRFGWGAVCSAVGHVAVLAISIVAALDSDGDPATAFWYWVGFAASGLVAALLLWAAAREVARGQASSSRIALSGVALVVAAVFAVLSALADNDLAFLIVPVSLGALNLVLLLAIRSLASERVSVG